MGDILNIKNLSAYCGGFAHKSSKSAKKPPEARIGWYLYNTLMERLPVLVFRVNSVEDNDKRWPLSWKRDRNLQLAVDLTLNMMKAWQAYRPGKPKDIIKPLAVKLPNMILTFQNTMREYGVRRARDVIRMKSSDSDEVVIRISKTVGELSSYKNNQNPMMASKILNCFFPEFFPLWDTKRIKQDALRRENLDSVLSSKVQDALRHNNEAAKEYARYFGLMLKEFTSISYTEYKNIKRAFIRHSEVNEHVFYEFYDDIGPYLFEFCLLGKHSAHIRK